MQVVAIVNDDVVHIQDLHYRTWSPIQFVGVDGECIDIATAYIKEDMANNFLIAKGKVRQQN